MKSIGSLPATLVTVLGAVLGVACGGTSGPGAPTSGTATSADSLASVSSVESALARPTAAISVETMKPIGAHAAWLQDVMPAFDAVLAMGSDAAKACLTTSATGGSYDLACVTQGHVTGSLSFQTGASAVPATAKLENACVDDYCASATVALDVAGDGSGAATLAVTATVSAGYGDSDTFSFGAQGAMGATPGEARLGGKLVYFTPEGTSVVVDGGSGIIGVFTFTVLGTNGPFECTFVGDTGTCNGASVFAF